MSTEVTMPRLSDTMTEGTVLRWLRSHSEEVRQGDAIVEIESDKVTTELSAPAGGTLHVVVGEGTTAAIGAVLAYLGEPEQVAEHSSAAVYRPSEPSEDAGVYGETFLTGVVPPAAPTLKPANRGSDATSVIPRVRATPVARRMAQEAGIDLATIAPGSGPRGRVHKVDVECFVASSGPGSAARHPVKAVNGEVGPGELIARDRIQDLIARRMAQAKREIPHFYLSVTVDCRRAMRLRRKLLTKADSARISMTDLIVQACARALRSIPQVNAAWEEDGIRRYEAVNIGLAVALDDEGVIVPVLREVDRLTLAEIAELRTHLVHRARSRTITGDQLHGATFTVSNLGMFGVEEFHAIINPPESGILAVGSVEDRLVPRHGRPAVRPMATISLSADHRVYSGATAAAFLAAVKTGLEQPVRTLAGLQ